MSTNEWLEGSVADYCQNVVSAQFLTVKICLYSWYEEGHCVHSTILFHTSSAKMPKIPIQLSYKKRNECVRMA